MKTTTHRLALEAILTATMPYLGKLHARGIATPKRSEAETAIAGCLNSRNGQWRRTKPRGLMNDPSVLLWVLVKFHRSSGSLWSYPFLAEPELRDRMDTLALVLLGNQSNAAAAAWKRELGH